MNSLPPFMGQFSITFNVRKPPILGKSKSVAGFPCLWLFEIAKGHHRTPP